ncbi:helix-turn-helix transcriptional regulator [bacterium]|nr:helix-turn-helix transcriptional regulator [bacterium]
MIEFKLDDLLWERRKTAEEVKMATGISAATLSNIRNGKNTNISIKTLDKLCKYFHCRVSDILEYVPDIQ